MRHASRSAAAGTSQTRAGVDAIERENSDIFTVNATVPTD
jgi:hypothetical protein